MAVGFAVYGLVEALIAPTAAQGGNSPDIVGPRWLVATSYVAASLLLVARRRYPFGVFVAIVFALALPTAIVGSSEGFGGVLPLVVALYTVGAHCERRRAFLAVGVFAAGALVDLLRDPLNHDLANLAGAIAWYLPVVSVLVAGMYVRTRRLYVAELRDRAELAEQEREDRARRAVADERTRIARELHDAVAHAMSVMVVQAEAAEEMLDIEAERARRPIRRVQRVGREGLAEMRRLLGVLRQGEAPALAPQPSLDALPGLVEAMREAGLDVELRIEGEPRPLPAGLDISAYRIIQEALTNTLNHARASHVDVRLEYGDVIGIEVVDDGVGAKANGDGGHGLAGMRERVALYGGVLEAGAHGQGGFAVRASLPLEGTG